jgi:HK97 gp10 family phage protein
MTDGMRAEIKGLNELTEGLKEFSKDVQINLVRNAMRGALAPIIEQAQKNFAEYNRPETQENIPANVTARFSSRRFKQTGDVKYRIGIQGGARQRRGAKPTNAPGGDTFYWRFIETGTEKLPARKPLRRAFGEKAPMFFTDFRDRLKLGMARKAKQIAKRQRARSGFQTRRREFFGLEET